MDFLVISSESSLCRLCRELLTTVGGPNWTLSTCQPGETIPAADLYLWDFQPDIPFPSAFNHLAKHLFLVHTRDLPAFRQGMVHQEANILLKPLTRVVLSAFLGLAVRAHEQYVCHTYSLRADRDEILQRLIQANLRLQEYDQERTNFLVRAVHDFRAPLTALSGYCGLLLSQALGELSPDQAEVIGRMQRSTRRLSRMANGMFELGIGRRVQRSLDLRRADIQDCIDQATHEVAPFAQEKQISISGEVSPAPPNLYFDPCQIEQVLINILDNACKFAPRGGNIEIHGYPYFFDRRDTRQVSPVVQERRNRTSDEPNTFRVDIRDSGSQIPQNQLERIFEEYTSTDGKQDRSGGGLGLAICRFIVERHAGRIWAENTQSGPRFSFTIPLHTERYRDSGSG